ncbi:MFS transporter [Francisella tularensis subsp. holarctica]|uniref:MFS transporter n=1 Tax=Francisella tularensis TaxID=263 RepID=UPI001981F591|nr:MFS transporter [Francisella tularensis]MBN3711837.1 MFS transporter [Francisella tularensis subsp. holarctica]MBN3715036.1 MFS transporter [Francisella tularensis subsp. holarctica]
MQLLKLKLLLFLIFFISAILLNSVGIVILQSVTHYKATEIEASILEACKDLTIAVVSFSICSFIPRFGYKNSMLTGLAIITIGCITMVTFDSFLTTKILFILTGVAFALIKVSVYSTVGLITDNSKAHANLMSLLEGISQMGVVLSFFIFSIFIYFGNWFGTYWLLAGLCVIAFLLLLFTKLDESAAKITQNSNFLADTLNMLKLIKLPIVLLFIISVFFYVFIEQSVQSWLPTFNTKVLHLSASTSVFMASFFALNITAGRIIFGFIMKKIDWKKIILIALICCAILII